MARKANKRKIIPLLIAGQTVVAAVARLALSSQRLVIHRNAAIRVAHYRL